MNALNYKGYTARIHFDERDGIFVGRVLGLRSTVSFHGESVKELTAQFQLALNDYLNDCKESGVTPDKPASGRLMLRIPSELHSIALLAAQSSGQSLNQWAAKAIQAQAEHAQFA
jgi:predicted HicB family RNase H-like nuclease